MPSPQSGGIMVAVSPMQATPFQGRLGRPVSTAATVQRVSSSRRAPDEATPKSGILIGDPLKHGSRNFADFGKSGVRGQQADVRRARLDWVDADIAAVEEVEIDLVGHRDPGVVGLDAHVQPLGPDRHRLGQQLGGHGASAGHQHGTCTDLHFLAVAAYDQHMAVPIVRQTGHRLALPERRAASLGGCGQFGVHGVSAHAPARHRQRDDKLASMPRDQLHFAQFDGAQRRQVGVKAEFAQRPL